MPLFEYQCKSCQAIEEVLAKASDPPPKVCEACGKKGKMEKVVSLTSFQLKGGGWYKDLYSSVPKADGGAAKESSTSTSTTTSTSSETAPKKETPKKEGKAKKAKAS